MILYIEDVNGTRDFYRLNTVEDFEPLFKLFPRTEEMVLFSQSIEDAAQSIARYLSSNRTTAWVEQGELSKGLKDIMAAVSLGAASLLHPTATAPDQHKAPQQQVQKYPSKPFGSQPEDAFLWTVMQIESSGGKNTAHKLIHSGAYKGQTAVGKWGFLPSTVREMVERHRSAGKITPQIHALDTMTRDELNHKFKTDPNLELEMARFAARHVLHRQRGDVRRAAYAWTMGHNMFPGQIDNEDLSGHDYVKKFVHFDQNNPIRAGLRKPHSSQKASPASAPMLKTESPPALKLRLMSWKKKRSEEGREPAPRDHTYTPDPGRIRQDPDDTKSVISRIMDRKKK
jgi:hypothetical protein